MESIERLKHTITRDVFVRAKDEPIGLRDDPDEWTFDFRRILLNGEHANLIANLFYERYKDEYPFQLCGMEIAGVPLVTALMMKFYEKGHRDINAFFIRKSRKKTATARLIEGTVVPDVKIILVDDTMNAGHSFWRQIEALEELGHTPILTWSILRYRDHSFYERFYKRNIRVESLFELNDLTDMLGERVKNLKLPERHTDTMPFTVNWMFKSEHPVHHYVFSKSQPILDRTKIYVGSDNRTLWALNQNDGSVAWSYKVGLPSRKKSIFSNPALYKDLVIFGSYDGNVYALDKESGKKKWVFLEADWVGSSPAVAHDLDMVFIGLEFGLWKKRGGIVALNARTGEKIWEDYTHPALTHSSPLYIERHREVVIGSNDGTVRMYDAETGTPKWTFTTFGGADFDSVRDGGFGKGDIKESFAYDEAHDYIVFGSIDGFLYVLDRKNGHLVHHHKCEYAIMSTPCVFDGRVYFASLDKHLRALDLDTRTIMFDIDVDNTRIFGSPVVINNRLYIGTNAGRLHELDPKTGEHLGYFQTTERITNNVCYNPHTDRYFLPTVANEIVCLSRHEPSASNERATSPTAEAQ